MYSLRQQLSLGRYAPEEVDELGQPTGRARKVAVSEEITEKIRPLVLQLVAVHTENPPRIHGEGGKPRIPAPSELEAAGDLVELESLQREAYHFWGIKLDLETRRKRTPVGANDEVLELAAQGLSEQRERLLDLIDRVVAAIVEESCPSGKMPEDWDWQGLKSGFRDLFNQSLERPVERLGEAERVVREVYQAAEATYLEREARAGVDNMLRFFRIIYTEAIDVAWVDHLQNMEHLRDGIGLRGYGQRDPKNEYKKEGYNLFLNMMANVSSKVLTRLFSERLATASELEAMEREAEARQSEELARAVARHEGDSLPPAPPVAPDLDAKRRDAQSRVPSKAAQVRIGAQDPCPCGSGKKFKDCHGKALYSED